MKTILTHALLPLLALAVPALAVAETIAEPAPGLATLAFSDNRAPVAGLEDMNAVLSRIGVMLTRVEPPAVALDLAKAAMAGPLSAEQSAEMLRLFTLDRETVLAAATGAGRVPVIDGGGALSTAETGVPPYPKVYDLASMGPADHLAAKNKFGRLHVNATDDMTGVDEVMTLTAGGPWVWYFQLEECVAVELRMGTVLPGEQAWRISYPGLVPHGADFYTETGICVAYITGPETWQMRYEAPVPQGDLMGTNPFIRFDS